MATKRTRARSSARTRDSINRPTALTLATHIVKALVNDGMAWVSIPAVAVTAFLYHHHFQNDILLAVIFGGLAIIALVRGCLNWQNDLDEYQRDLALERHREKLGGCDTIPGFFPTRRY